MTTEAQQPTVSKNAASQSQKKPQKPLTRISTCTQAMAVTFPIMGCLIAILTILSCYYTLMSKPHFQPGGKAEWLRTPVISLMGCGDPEHLMYQVGFTLSAILLLISGLFFKQIIVDRMDDNDEMKQKAYYAYLAIPVACFGICAQGVITLQEDALEVLILSPSGKVTTQSIIHQLFAMFFFMPSAYHGYNMSQVYWNSTSRVLKPAQDKGGAVLKTCFGYGLQTFLTMVSSFYHPTTGTKEHNQQNMGGLTQWIVVISYICLFGSYSYDFFWMFRHENSLPNVEGEAQKKSS